MTFPEINAPEMTWLFIKIVTIVCVVYDLIIIFAYGHESSISHVLAKKSVEHPTILFGAGLLCGHLFLPLFR